MANGASAAESPAKTGEGRERREGQEITEGKTSQQKLKSYGIWGFK